MVSVAIHVLIVSGRKEVDFRVGSNDPEAVVLAFKRVDGSPFVQVPDPNGLILASGQDKILMWVKQTATGVLEVTSAGIDLPLSGVSTSCKLIQEECP